MFYNIFPKNTAPSAFSPTLDLTTPFSLHINILTTLHQINLTLKTRYCPPQKKLHSPVCIVFLYTTKAGR